MHIIWRLFGLLKKYWKASVLSFVFLLVATGFALVTPNLLRLAIDNGISIDSQTGIVTVHQSILWAMGLGIVAAQILRAVTTFGQNYISGYTGQKIAFDLRNRLYDQIQRLSFAFHDKAQTGQLMSRATQDVEAVQTFVSMGAIRILYIVITFFGILGILLYLNWSLAVVSLVCIPPVAVIAIRMSNKMRPVWTRVQQELATMTIVLQENLSGMRVVKAFSKAKRETDKFEKEAHKYFDDSLITARIQAFSGPLMNLLFAISSALIIWWGGHEIINGQLTAGELTQFYFYLTMMVAPVRMLGYMVNMIFGVPLQANESLRYLTLNQPLKKNRMQQLCKT